MGLFDKLLGSLGSGKGKRRVSDVEARFERLRSAVSGTMSNFIVARDRESDKIVGVKLCDLEKVTFFESRFKGLKKPSEGEIATSMHHPNIVKTLEYGLSTKGAPYLVMEFIDGPGLQTLIHNREAGLLEGKRLALILQMADALLYVHAQGYIHRDICPRNFICTSDVNHIKLIDFGLTIPATKEFMAPGNRTGTPLYMAPEIVRRRPTDQRVDIFSFGVTCYQLLTFEHPWPGSETSGLAALNHDTSNATDIFRHRPDLNKQLGGLVMQAIRPMPQDRIQSMEVFVKLLKQIAAETETVAK
jgi:eukaryotic-like serine/threonine-protein kinase